MEAVQSNDLRSWMGSNNVSCGACCSTSCPSLLWNANRYLGPASITACLTAGSSTAATRPQANVLAELEDPFKTVPLPTIMNCAKPPPRPEPCRRPLPISKRLMVETHRLIPIEPRPRRHCAWGRDKWPAMILIAFVSRLCDCRPILPTAIKRCRGCRWRKDSNREQRQPSVLSLRCVRCEAFTGTKGPPATGKGQRWRPARSDVAK